MKIIQIEDLPDEIKERYQVFCALLDRGILKETQSALAEILTHYEKNGAEIPAVIETQYARLLLLEAAKET